MYKDEYFYAKRMEKLCIFRKILYTSVVNIVLCCCYKGTENFPFRYGDRCLLGVLRYDNVPFETNKNMYESDTYLQFENMSHMCMHTNCVKRANSISYLISNRNCENVFRTLCTINETLDCFYSENKTENFI